MIVYIYCAAFRMGEEVVQQNRCNLNPLAASIQCSFPRNEWCYWLHPYEADSLVNNYVIDYIYPNFAPLLLIIWLVTPISLVIYPPGHPAAAAAAATAAAAKKLPPVEVTRNACRGLCDQADFQQLRTSKVAVGIAGVEPIPTIRPW